MASKARSFTKPPTLEPLPCQASEALIITLTGVVRRHWMAASVEFIRSSHPQALAYSFTKLSFGCSLGSKNGPSVDGILINHADRNSLSSVHRSCCIAESAPALSPLIVTLSASPPKRWILLLTKRKASIWSSMPRLTLASSNQEAVLRKPRGPRR